MKKNTSKIKGAKNIARVLFKLNHFLEPYGLTSDMKRLRFVNRSLLRWHTGIETPTQK
jgi:hypothetical protein